MEAKGDGGTKKDEDRTKKDEDRTKKDEDRTKKDEDRTKKDEDEGEDEQGPEGLAVLDVDVEVGVDLDMHAMHGVQVMPTDHGHRVASFHKATPALVNEATTGALKAQKHWEGRSLCQRVHGRDTKLTALSRQNIRSHAARGPHRHLPQGRRPDRDQVPRRRVRRRHAGCAGARLGAGPCDSDVCH